jgi:hypothetical protein
MSDATREYDRYMHDIEAAKRARDTADAELSAARVAVRHARDRHMAALDAWGLVDFPHTGPERAAYLTARGELRAAEEVRAAARSVSVQAARALRDLGAAWADASHARHRAWAARRGRNPNT